MLNIPVTGEPVVDEKARAATSWYNYWMEVGFELRKLITATATGIVNSWNGRTGAVMPAAGDYDASQITNFTETAQDAVGNILIDSARVDFTYDDAANTIRADLVVGSVANLFLSNMSAGTVKMRRPGSGGAPTDELLATLKSDMAFTKADVGLGNVDNTSDANKPVSTAQQAALDLKADLASPTFTGDPKAPTPLTADNDTSIATTAFVKAQGYVTSSGVTSVSGTTPVVSSGGATPAISMPAATGSVPGHLTAADWTTFNAKAPTANPSFTGTLTSAGLIDATGGQIKFPATASLSSNPNTLDDYEEGTWTPVFSAASTPPTGVTYSAQSGSYTKIGKLVYVTWTLTLTSKGTGGVGQVIITGLPFSANAFAPIPTPRGGGYTITAGKVLVGMVSGAQVPLQEAANNGTGDVTWAMVSDTFNNFYDATYTTNS